MNHKRKRSRRQVRCTQCTEHRWKGNEPTRLNVASRRQLQESPMETLTETPNHWPQSPAEAFADDSWHNEMQWGDWYAFLAGLRSAGFEVTITEETA